MQNVVVENVTLRQLIEQLNLEFIPPIHTTLLKYTELS